jgi:hypothetical protein
MCGPRLQAQINGTVADSSGAVLPGVTVVAIQTETGFRREVVSESDGSFALLNLPIGPYRLEATLSGFRTFSQTGIVLQVNSNPVIPVAMQLGSLEETVSVEAAAPLVETRNPAVGTSSQRAGRGAAARRPQRDLARRDRRCGGRYGQPSSRSLTQSRGIAIAGGQQFGVAYQLDGALHNNVYDGVNLPLPFPDAMQEFRSRPARRTRRTAYKAGGTVSVATKAGTNLFHGDCSSSRATIASMRPPVCGDQSDTGERTSDGWYGTSSAACSADRSSKTRSSSSAPIRARAPHRRRPTS